MLMMMMILPPTLPLPMQKVLVLPMLFLVLCYRLPPPRPQPAALLRPRCPPLSPFPQGREDLPRFCRRRGLGHARHRASARL